MQIDPKLNLEEQTFLAASRDLRLDAFENYIRGLVEPGIEERIGFKFADKALLERALTHNSALSGGPQNRAASYQRLEFLGDHVLGLVISDMLYRAFPKANEG